MRVILVEDSDVNAQQFESTVRDISGIVLHRVKLLQEALVERQDYDIAVVDLYLPDSSAEETVAAIEQFWPMPVLVYSGSDSPEWTIAAGRSGAVGYLLKSSSQEQVVASLYCALGQALRLAAASEEQQKLREKLLRQLARIT